MSRFCITEDECTPQQAFDLLRVASGDPGEHMTIHDLSKCGMEETHQTALLALSNAFDQSMFSEEMELGLIGLLNLFRTKRGRRMELPAT